MHDPNDPLRQTVRVDVAHGLLGVAFVVGFIVGVGGWLFLLYDRSVSEQSMIWFLGALPAGIVCAYLARWGMVALLTR
jgi:hypothetical protein